jgi:hypothetical protein
VRLAALEDEVADVKWKKFSVKYKETKPEK